MRVWASHACTLCTTKTSHISAAVLPPSLSAHLASSFVGHTACSELMARTLVDDLTALAPEHTALNRFCQQQGKRMVRALQRDPTLRHSLLQGDTNVGDILMQLDKREEATKQMFNTIQAHHHRLRKHVSAAKEEATASWEAAIGDREGLQRYAEAALEIGTRVWVQQGIGWCARQAINFFHGDGLDQLLTEEARERSGSRCLTKEEQQSIDAATAPLQHEKRPIRLLDVGSCGSLFDGIESINVTALDLHPNSNFPLVYQSDFLTLEVGPPGSAPLVQPQQNQQPRSLLRLAANSTDVVVMSLVLSYLPLPSQRSAMVAKARRLLPPNGPLDGQRGLLLIHETLALDTKVHAEQSNLWAWISVIESLGFIHLRHETLRRSHVIAFATRSLDAAELEDLQDTAALPELRLRREQVYGDSSKPCGRRGVGPGQLVEG